MGRSYVFFVLLLGAFAWMVGGLRQSDAGTVDVEQASSAAPVDSADGSERLLGHFAEGQAIRLPRSPDGHFYADIEINGQRIHALVDTGASIIALSREDARTAGLAASISMPNVVGQGASGAVRGEVVTLDRVSLGSKEVRDLPAVVLDAGAQSLLGQSFLSKFASVEIRGDTMVLE